MPIAVLQFPPLDSELIKSGCCIEYVFIIFRVISVKYTYFILLILFIYCIFIERSTSKILL